MYGHGKYVFCRRDCVLILSLSTQCYCVLIIRRLSRKTRFKTSISRMFIVPSLSYMTFGPHRPRPGPGLSRQVHRSGRSGHLDIPVSQGLAAFDDSAGIPGAGVGRDGSISSCRLHPAVTIGAVDSISILRYARCWADRDTTHGKPSSRTALPHIEVDRMVWLGGRRGQRVDPALAERF